MAVVGISILSLMTSVENLGYISLYRNQKNVMPFSHLRHLWRNKVAARLKTKDR